MIALHQHLRLSNSERLHLALDILHDPTPRRSARQKVQDAVSVLEGATPGRTQKELEICGACHRAARGLRTILSQPPTDLFAENTERFRRARLETAP